MLSKTSQLHAGRAVRSIARTYQDAPARYTPAQWVNEQTQWEAQNRGYHRNHEWIGKVEYAAIRAIEARIQSAAPNAANAAPLMPVCDTCMGKGIYSSTAYGLYGTTCTRCDGTGRLRGTREGFPDIIRPGHLGADESLPAYAWPGGYPLAYYPITNDRGHEWTDICGDVLCSDCATTELHDAAVSELEWERTDTGMIAQVEEEVHDRNLTCDNCNAVIAYQSWCSACDESVDCDEAHPYHLCPKTEPYTVWYLPTVPSDEWKAFRYDPDGPEKAQEIAHSLRVQGLAAFVHVQPTRLSFPPVISEEEE